MNEAGVAPPGVMPIQQPTMQERIDVAQYFSRVFQVMNTAPRRILAAAPWNLRPASIDDRISPMPNRPITAIRKSKPLSSSEKPKVKSQVARHFVHADRRQREAEAHGRDHFPRRALAHADEAREGQEVDREVRGRPEFQGKLGDHGRQERDHHDGDEGADERRREGGGQGFVGAALLRHRVAVEGGRDRPRFARNIEQDRGDGAAEQGAPIDARQHDDRRRRRHRERQRQQDRDAVGAAEARQHADDDTEQDADQHQQTDCTTTTQP